MLIWALLFLMDNDGPGTPAGPTPLLRPIRITPTFTTGPTLAPTFTTGITLTPRWGADA